MIGQYNQIQYESECPTPYAESHFKEFCSRGHNQIDKLDPEEGNPLPDHWRDWHREIDCEEFKSLPYRQNVTMDLHHLVEDPVPLQPAKTRNRTHYQIYFLSPSKIVIFVRTEGFEYTFCDRFCPEQIYYYTQEVKPGAMEEEDPQKRLSMFSVKVRCYARIHIMKTLMLVKGQIMKENERQARADVERAHEGLGKFMKQSIQKRLQHYINPVVNQQPTTP